MTSYYQADREDRYEKTLRECRDAVRRAKRPKLFCGLTALKLLKIDLPTDSTMSDDYLHVCDQDLGSPTRMKGVKSHYWICQFPTRLVDAQFNIWCMHPFDVLMQLSQFVGEDELVVLAESMLRAKLGLDYASLVSLTFPKNARGRARYQVAASLVRSGTDSPQETRLRLRLLHHGLREPVINYRIPGEFWSGNRPVTVDLAYPEQRVLIEYDGVHHRKLLEQWNIDHDKRFFLESEGWHIVVVNAAMMEDVDEICDRIKMMVIASSI